MARSDQRLDHRAQQLAAEGADPLRIEALECARQFKRSWIQMAELLLRVRQTQAYERWGYEDLYGYCAAELLIKRATVDKLVCSFTMIARHAPAALQADGVEQPIPTLDAVSYFAQALGQGSRKVKPQEQAPAPVVEQLRHAVFDELRPVSALRREFNNVLYAKSETDKALDGLEQARAQVNRLTSMLPQIEGLSSRRIAEVETTLAELEDDLEQLIARLKKTTRRRAS